MFYYPCVSFKENNSMRKNHTVPLWLSLLLSLLFSATTFTSTYSQLASGVYTITVSKDDLPQNASEEDMNRFVGKWEWTLSEYGRMKLTLDGKVKVEGKYTSTADELKITDEKGEIACNNSAGLEIGTYKWMLENKKLTLIVVDDKCEGRRQFLTHAPWMKEK
jgi:hypothetical protein